MTVEPIIEYSLEFPYARPAILWLRSGAAFYRIMSSSVEYCSIFGPLMEAASIAGHVINTLLNVSPLKSVTATLGEVCQLCRLPFETVTALISRHREFILREAQAQDKQQINTSRLYRTLIVESRWKAILTKLKHDEAGLLAPLGASPPAPLSPKKTNTWTDPSLSPASSVSTAIVSLRATETKSKSKSGSGSNTRNTKLDDKQSGPDQGTTLDTKLKRGRPRRLVKSVVPLHVEGLKLPSLLDDEFSCPFCTLTVYKNDQYTVVERLLWHIQIFHLCSRTDHPLKVNKIQITAKYFEDSEASLVWPSKEIFKHHMVHDERSQECHISVKDVSKSAKAGTHQAALGNVTDQEDSKLDGMNDRENVILEAKDQNNIRLEPEKNRENLDPAGDQDYFDSKMSKEQKGLTSEGFKEQGGLTLKGESKDQEVTNLRGHPLSESAMIEFKDANELKPNIINDSKLSNLFIQKNNNPFPPIKKSDLEMEQTHASADRNGALQYTRPSQMIKTLETKAGSLLTYPFATSKVAPQQDVKDIVAALASTCTRTASGQNSTVLFNPSYLSPIAASSSGSIPFLMNSGTTSNAKNKVTFHVRENPNQIENKTSNPYLENLSPGPKGPQRLPCPVFQRIASTKTTTRKWITIDCPRPIPASPEITSKEPKRPRLWQSSVRTQSQPNMATQNPLASGLPSTKSSHSHLSATLPTLKSVQSPPNQLTRPLVDDEFLGLVGDNCSTLAEPSPAQDHLSTHTVKSPFTAHQQQYQHQHPSSISKQSSESSILTSMDSKAFFPSSSKPLSSIQEDIRPPNAVSSKSNNQTATSSPHPQIPFVKAPVRLGPITEECSLAPSNQFPIKRAESSKSLTPGFLFNLLNGNGSSQTQRSATPPKPQKPSYNPFVLGSPPKLQEPASPSASSLPSIWQQMPIEIDSHFEITKGNCSKCNAALSSERPNSCPRCNVAKNSYCPLS